MSANDIIQLLTDENGEIDIDEALHAINRAAAELEATVSLTDIVNLLSLRIDVLEAAFTELILQTQAGTVQVMQSFDSLLLNGKESRIPDYDTEREREAIQKHLQLEYTSAMYDYLVEGSDEKEDGDDGGAPDPAPQGRAGEDAAEAGA